jgi:hypothetical protein
VGLSALLLGVLPGGPFGARPATNGARLDAPGENGPADVALRIEDGSGAPVAGATLRVEGLADVAPAQSDAHGAARLEGVPRGPQVVDVEAAGFARARLDVEVGPGLRPLEIVLRPEVRLGGRVVDEGGEPLPGAQVIARLDADVNAPPYELEAGEDGTFEVHGLPG